MIITAQAYARAGLVGNPSDGYFGKTISFIIRNFAATVRLWESPHFEIVPTHGDFARFDVCGETSMDEDWRRGRDSNPRYGCPYAAFRVRCFQPLSHLSKPP